MARRPGTRCRGCAVPSRSHHSRHSLEQLCRYGARPAFVHERLHRTSDGKLLYALKRTWRDGSSHVVFDPQTLLERLAALVPRPKFPLVTYHGVLAPASALRHRIVPEPPPPPSCPHEGEPEPAPERPNKGRRRRYYRWAELLQRVFARTVLVCPHCGGARRVLAFLTDLFVVRKILAHLGLATEPPPVARARPPPQEELAF